LNALSFRDIELLYIQRLANFVKRTATLEHPVLQSFNSECIFNLLLYSMCVCAAFGKLKISITTKKKLEIEIRESRLRSTQNKFSLTLTRRWIFCQCLHVSLFTPTRKSLFPSCGNMGWLWK